MKFRAELEMPMVGYGIVVGLTVSAKKPADVYPKQVAALLPSIP